LNSLFFPRLAVFGLCVIAFFVGLYFNRRDDERDKILYEEQRKLAQERKEKQEQARQQEQALYWERMRLSSAAMAMTEESQPSGLGGGAAKQSQGQQPKRTIH
jgi:hypothetical protein